MENANIQCFDALRSRKFADETRKTADETCKTAGETRKTAGKSKVVINNISVSVVNINAIRVENHGSYHNGAFIPVFQSAIQAIACDQNIKNRTIRILLYIIGNVDENNCFCSSIKNIAVVLNCSEDTVERAIKQLISMNIICRKEESRERSLYELSDKVLNPRVAFKGNTRKLCLDGLPLLLGSEGKEQLLPSSDPFANTSDF